MSTTDNGRSDLSVDDVLRLVKQVTTLAQQRPTSMYEASAAIQALLEGRPLGYSSLDDKLIYKFGGIRFSERQLREDRLYVEVGNSAGEVQVQPLRRHRNGGGWVPLDQDEMDRSKAFVAESAYVGPDAKVMRNARVLDEASVDGNALVSENAEVSGRARVHGRAVVIGEATISGNAQVYERARVLDRAVVTDDARVFGGATLHGSVRAYESAVISGDVYAGGTFSIGDSHRITHGSFGAGDYMH